MIPLKRGLLELTARSCSGDKLRPNRDLITRRGELSSDVITRFPELHRLGFPRLVCPNRFSSSHGRIVPARGSIARWSNTSAK